MVRLETRVVSAACPPERVGLELSFCAHAALWVAVGSSCACEPVLDAGTWGCASDARSTNVALDAATAFPWSTGFERGFCDYASTSGFCYSDSDASYRIVTSPAHTGRFAAAFTVDSDNPNARQARCVRQGVLPIAAYYGAWYFVPQPRTNSGNWNLFHFQGAEPASLHGLWDVSLSSPSDGELQLYLFDFLGGMTVQSNQVTPIPVGSWFHVEVYLKRASDPSGEIALYQDGQLLVRQTNLITDDTQWGQWYVGNLGTALTPASSTVYVDDISITDAL